MGLVVVKLFFSARVVVGLRGKEEEEGLKKMEGEFWMRTGDFLLVLKNFSEGRCCYVIIIAPS